VFSDGLTEAQNAEGKFFGTERLCKLIRSRASGSFADLYTATLKAIDDYSDESMLADDVTLVVAEYAPES
jgi:sigma-B regulation protein RsbU (phosphoserine phosphatase)